MLPHISYPLVTSTSSFGPWQAALIAALQLPAGGIPGVVLKKLNIPLVKGVGLVGLEDLSGGVVSE